MSSLGLGNRRSRVTCESRHQREFDVPSTETSPLRIERDAKSSPFEWVSWDASSGDPGTLVTMDTVAAIKTTSPRGVSSIGFYRGCPWAVSTFIA